MESWRAGYRSAVSSGVRCWGGAWGGGWWNVGTWGALAGAAGHGGGCLAHGSQLESTRRCSILP